MAETVDLDAPLQWSQTGRNGISVRLNNSLLLGGFKTLREAQSRSDKELLALTYFGPTSLKELRSFAN